MPTVQAVGDPGGSKARVTLSGAFSADLIPGILFVVAMALLAPRLQVPTVYVFDEVYHAYTAGQYAAGNHDAYVWNKKAPQQGVAYMWNHPPAGILFMTAGIVIWGDNSFGWRIGSAIFGATGIVIAYLLALAITRRRALAVVAALLLLVDGLYVVQSRVGMLDIYGTVFMLGAFFALHGYLTAPPEWVRGPLLRLGLFLGLAIATKWNAAYASLFIGLVVLGRGVLLYVKSGRSLRDHGVLAHLFWVPVGLIVLPALVYVAAYVPFFLTGHDVGQFVELQHQIFRYHTHLQATHTYQSRWWEWPLTLRPVWYATTRTHETVANIYANGNTVLYLAFVPAVIWVASRWFRRRDPAAIVLVIGFFGQWLPWAMVPRISFAYHFLPAVPFGCLAIAVVLFELFGNGLTGRAVAVAYAALAIGFFIYFYPIYTDLPLSPQAFERRIWLSSWK
jgi:dolichyl-phosphate-mannose--protein O-mannosyl transferase